MAKIVFARSASDSEFAHMNGCCWGHNLTLFILRIVIDLALCSLHDIPALAFDHVRRLANELIQLSLLYRFDFFSSQIRFYLRI